MLATTPIKADRDLQALYEKYQDPANPTQIDIDGTLAYLEDLQFDPEDLISLTLAFVLESPTTGVFEKDKFLAVWQEQGIKTVPAMKKYIASRHNAILADLGEFEKLYKFTFDFIKAGPADKTVNYELAVSYWQLLFGSLDELQESQGRLQEWYEFVGTEYKRDFSRDSWNMFYAFLKDIIRHDPQKFTGYDEMSAWPSVIDEYVEYLVDNDKLNFEQ